MSSISWEYKVMHTNLHITSPGTTPTLKFYLLPSKQIFSTTPVKQEIEDNLVS